MSQKNTKPIAFSFAFIHPKYWLLWFGIGVWWLLTQILPFKVQMYLGKLLGLFVLKFVKSRVRIAKTNIDRCFPELSEQERNALLKKHMISLGRGVFDTGIGWFWPKWRLSRHVEVRGIDILEKANEGGQGVLFLGLHFTSLELSSHGINGHTKLPIVGVYRAHDNIVYDRIQLYGREKHSRHFRAVPKQDLRGMIKCLRGGGVLYYLPDQDYGRKNSVFAPFFGIPTATVSATSQLAKVGKAKVLGQVAVRKADASGYIVTVYPHIEGFGELGEENDARLLNEFVEARVREYPDQYLWVHRRFKTRPDGEGSFYG